MQRTMIFGIGITLGFCFVLAAQPPSETRAYGLEDFTKEKGRFKWILTDPEADFARYQTVCPMEFQLNYLVRAGGPDGEMSGSLIRKKNKAIAAPDPEVRARYEEVITSSFEEVLKRREVLRFVEQPDGDTLLLRPAVMEMVSKMPSASGSRDELRGKIIAEGTFVCDMIDAQTGMIVAHISDRRKIKRGEGSSGDSESATLWADVEAWARRAAEDLCQELERLHG